MHITTISRGIVHCLPLTVACAIQRVNSCSNYLVRQVGWILSVLDQLQLNPAPAVAVLPLGTGNDLARTLNWGGVSGWLAGCVEPHHELGIYPRL